MTVTDQSVNEGAEGAAPEKATCGETVTEEIYRYEW